jgi:hypothetical protein
MKFFALFLLFTTAAFAQAPDYLVRSCATKPAVDEFASCANSTWVRPPNAQWVVVSRRSVTNNIWLRPAELIETDRVYACLAPNITAGAPFGSGCVDSSGAKAYLPGQTSNWLAISALTFAAPKISDVRFSWQPVTLDTAGAPIALKGYRIAIRRQDCNVASGNCAVAPWGSDVNVNRDQLTYTGENIIHQMCIRVQAVSEEGAAGAISDEFCKARQQVPAAVKGITGEIAERVPL